MQGLCVALTLNLIWAASDERATLSLIFFVAELDFKEFSNLIFISYSLLHWYSRWRVNRRGFEHVDASHGLDVFCRARMCEVHVLPILSYRPSLYYLMSPFLSSLLILMLNYFLSPSNLLVDPHLTGFSRLSPAARASLNCLLSPP